MTAGLRTYFARALTADERQDVHASAWSAHEIARRNTASVRSLWLLAGAAGVLCGVAGIVMVAALLPLKQTTVRFILVDRSTGFVGEAYAASDAPKLFDETVRDFALRQIVENCQEAVPGIADIQFHRCAIMLDPTQQRAFKERNDKIREGIGKTGFVRVESAPWRFIEVEARADQTYYYIVRFQQTTSTGSTTPKPEDWYCQMVLAFHPDWKISDDDRTANPTGAVVKDYACHNERAEGPPK